MSRPIFRFAPSPNGLLHLGHAYSALLNLKQARATNGKCLLRIEDIDVQRCTPELERAMLNDLEWIGFEWDEEPRRQSTHFDEYREAVERLVDRGLVYPSVLSRSEIRKRIETFELAGQNWPKDPDGAPVYPGQERDLDKDERRHLIASSPSVKLRLHMDRVLKETNKAFSWLEIEGNSQIKVATDPAVWGDVVLARKNVPASYHLCCVLDDALQGVSHVTRGKDLYAATSVHVVLQELLALPSPVYCHHKLILDEDGKKLSKSDRSKSIASLRHAGTTREEIHEMIFGGQTKPESQF